MFNLNSDNDGKNRLVLDHIGLAKTLSARFSSLPYEDRFQEACLGLMKAYRSYEPDKGVTFGSYARAVIMNQLKQYYKKEKMRLLFIVQDDCYEKNQDDGYIRGSIKYTELREDLKKYLGNFKVRILIEISNGKTQQECSQIFGISQPSISRIKNEARRVLESEIK